MHGSTTLEKVRSDALNLSKAECVELVYNLVVSLDGPQDAAPEKAWDAEILRRLSEIDAGTQPSLIERSFSAESDLKKVPDTFICSQLN